MVNGLHLYSAFIQSAVQFMPLIHPFTHTFTHQRRLAAMQGTNQLVRSNQGLGVLLRDTSTRPGWDRTGNPPTARRQLYLLSHIANVKAHLPFSLFFLYCCLMSRRFLELFVWSRIQRAFPCFSMVCEASPGHVRAVWTSQSRHETRVRYSQQKKGFILNKGAFRAH